jgi:hypothetical protein
MFNPALKAYRNLQIPTEEQAAKPNGGLLARGMKPKQDTNNLDPRTRVAKYVAEIRKARQGLNNG